MHFEHPAKPCLTPICVVNVVDAGPVRGVHFHKNQPLIVSGGDDYKIKVRMCCSTHGKRLV